ncbi:MAG: 2-amino-4-hydroxy-6-hydroxymethyldihydropteridine diphosphokinase [Pseudomonadota bacterium]|nr:2-amino-4-hydroxy-6-hydroxymethyldihydropteridine diphosphokinase [Pseudomonadota bacterium]
MTLPNSNSYLIAIGTNLGDRQDNIVRSREGLCAVGDEVAVASLYETRPDGGIANLPFLNTAIHYRTALAPLELLAFMQRLECSLGRVRRRRLDNRLIDLDILLWRDDCAVMRVVNFPHLKIPHPLMLERDYVLVPANEIASDWKHPSANASIHSLLNRSMRSTIIRKICY